MEKNSCTVVRPESKQMPDFEKLTPDNIEEEIRKLKLFDDDYQSDDDTRVSKNIIIENF